MTAARLFAVVLLGLTMSCSTSSRVQEGFVTNGATSLYYKALGKGEPIVVLHGGPGFDHQQFLPYLGELASDYKVILFDQRGTGLSTGPVDSASITIDTFISDIEAVREAFGIEKMNLVGHSWGGILAMHYAVRHPENLKSLILCSAGASVDCFTDMRAQIQRARPPEDTELLESIYASEAFQAQDPAAIERFWQVYFRVYFVDTTLASTMNLTFTENTITNGNAVAGYILNSVGEFNLYDELRVVRCPTLILHGDSDPMPVSYAWRIHESIPGSQIRILERSGHWIFVDATEPFCASIREFLSPEPAP